jgi:1-acyl-sn-glycerol-3-phosphate acyltransferase
MKAVRSFVGFLLTLSWFPVLSLLQRLLVWPAVTLFPARRVSIVSVWMKFCSRTLLFWLSVGGARSRITATIPTADPVLIVSNHQSLIDILVITLMGQPYVPAFVTRTRYGRFVPTVSLCVRMLGCPLIDPHDRRQSFAELKKHAAREHHGFIIFPEGHRTRTGELLPFKTAGLEILLRARRVPIYLVATDGYWVCPTLADFIFRMHRMDAHLAEFAQELRARIAERLEQMRAARGVAA